MRRSGRRHVLPMQLVSDSCQITATNFLEVDARLLNEIHARPDASVAVQAPDHELKCLSIAVSLDQRAFRIVGCQRVQRLHLLDIEILVVDPVPLPKEGIEVFASSFT